MAEEIKEVIPYSYEDIKKKIISQFRQRGYTIDNDSSNASLLADVLSYLTYSINVNTSFQVSEQILPLALYFKNIVNAAKNVGYEYVRRISYVYTLECEFSRLPTLDGNDKTTRPYIIPRYTKFSNGDKTYYYMGEDITFNLSNATIGNGFKFNINVKEGDLRKWEDYKSTQYFTVAAKIDKNTMNIVTNDKLSLFVENIEEDGIDLFLTYIDPITGFNRVDELWSKSIELLVDATNSNEKNKFFVKNNAEDNSTDIYFKVANIGTTVPIGTIVKANVLISSGPNGEAKTNIFKCDEDVFPFPYMKINSFSLHTTGTEVESGESIKENAPIIYNAANRAVVARDYISIGNRQPIVYKTQVWGGDEEEVIQLGNIWLSFIPQYRNTNYIWDQDNSRYYIADIINSYYLKDTELKSYDYDSQDNLLSPGILDTLDHYKVMTMRLHNRHPIYIDFDYTLKLIKYSISENLKNTYDKVFSVVNTYFEKHLNDFNTTYFESNIIKQLSLTLNDMSGVQLNTKLTIPLFKKNVNNELDSSGEMKEKIYIYLALPFEGLISKIVQTDSLDSEINKVIVDKDYSIIEFSYTNLETEDKPENNTPANDTENNDENDDNNTQQKPKTLTLIDDTCLPSLSSNDFGFPISVEYNKPSFIGSITTKDDNVNGSFINSIEIHYPIIINAVNVGLYKVYYTNQKRCIILEFKDPAFFATLNNEYPRRLIIKYPSNNLSFIKNSVPRLSQIKFVAENERM